MPHSRLLLPLLFLALGACTGVRGQATADPAETPGLHIDSIAIDRLVQRYLDLDIFSGVVLVAQAGRPVYHRAFGLADRDRERPNTIATRFDIGSMNKSFTNAVVLQLIGEGKLRRDDRVGDHLRGFAPEVARTVEVGHLLDHTSGLGDYLAEPGFFELPRSEQTPAKILERVTTMHLRFAPGTDRAYSNAGYIVLGAIIEAVTGRSYYDNVKRRILEPLKLRRTVVDSTKASTPDRAIGYYFGTLGERYDNDGILMVPTPAGGFLSTAVDVLTFYRSYFLGDELFSDELARQDERLAFARSLRESGRALPLAGGFQGANSVVYAMVADDIFIVVLANMDEPVAEQLGAGIFALVNGREPRAPTLKTNRRLYAAYRAGGVDRVAERFAKLTDGMPEGEPRDYALNQVGYDLLHAGEVAAATEIFALNTRLFPAIANTWDSLGEAYLRAGDRAAALQSYRRALEIRPDLPSALAAVRQITGQ